MLRAQSVKMSSGSSHTLGRRVQWPIHFFTNTMNYHDIPVEQRHYVREPAYGMMTAKERAIYLKHIKDMVDELHGRNTKVDNCQCNVPSYKA